MPGAWSTFCATDLSLTLNGSVSSLSTHTHETTNREQKQQTKQERAERILSILPTGIPQLLQLKLPHGRILQD